MNGITAPIRADAEVAVCLDDAAFVRAMLQVEAALAKVQGDLTVIPKGSSAAISNAVADLDVSVADLADGVARTGVPVPALVAAMRRGIAAPHSDWVHWGATSQDIIDSAYALCHRSALGVVSDRLGRLIDGLHATAKAHERTVMMGRTRHQLATPITFGLRVSQWAHPLILADTGLPPVLAHATSVQFGGASGSRSALGGDGADVARALSDALDMPAAPPWHTDRSRLQRLADWLTALVDALGKMASDVILMARGELGELRIAAGGGSSTMPHKSNPVPAEAIVTCMHLARGYRAGLSSVAVQAEERDGGPWSAEWVLMPQLIEVVGAALRHALDLVDRIHPNVDEMRSRIEKTPAVLAEAAVFGLAQHIGRVAAEQTVKGALASGQPLAAALIAAVPTLDPDKILALETFIDPAARVSAEIFALRQPPQP